MNEIKDKEEVVLMTRLEERLVHKFTPFLEKLGYRWSIQAAEEYGNEVAIFKYWI